MQKLSLLVLMIIFIAVSGFHAPDGKPGAGDLKCMDCHDDLLLGSTKHTPAEKDCLICHKLAGTKHPGEDNGMVLVSAMPELCYSCHNAVTENRSTHSPALKGNCISCHSPHASDAKKLIYPDSKKACLACHNKTFVKGDRTIPNIQQEITEAKVIHPALNGGCTSCHVGHASEFPFLLNTRYPAAKYVTAAADSFELCFLCHDSDLLDKETTTTATNFRNGNKNLHKKHINGNKGRNCYLCHDVHASVQDHLIADKVPFGKWEMTIQYTATENGGTCMAGCHSAKSYTRQ